MRKRKFDLYFVFFVLVITICYFVYNHTSAESRGVEAYSVALESYKAVDYEKAYQEFAKVPSGSTLKLPALFRQARCATNMQKPELAIKKYGKIVRNGSKSSIAPISQYNMAILMFEMGDNVATKYFKDIIKKYPASDYAIASEYYLGIIKVLETKDKPKKAEKLKQEALNHFKAYIEKSSDGRFSIKSINAINKLGLSLKNYDNLLIAKSYYLNGEYEKSQEYLNKTTLSESWSDFAKNEYKLNNKDKTIYYTELGLKQHAETTPNVDVYEVIDNYIALFPTKKEGISKLLSMDLQSTGADYVFYLNCRDVVDDAIKSVCFKNLYEKYPNGQFSAESLYNVFISKYMQRKYYEAQRLGILHLKKFPNVKSTPAVIYFMGKISNKLKHYDSANNYYNQVLNKYPDSYYAFRANYNLHKEDGLLPFLELNVKPVIFPYKKSLDNNLVVKLAYLNDYDLVEELCKRDKFIQSWVAYEKGNYTISSVLARNAMDELQEKPAFDDLRWRLVYPTHYYNTVEKVKGDNNPIILQSILKEESHFNPYAQSYVGAVGLMQLMPATYNEVVNQYNISKDWAEETRNIAAGSLYYERLKKSLGSKDLYALSAYNGGIGSVTKWLSKIIYNDIDEFVEQIPYPETKIYVKKVFRTYWVYGNIY